MPLVVNFVENIHINYQCRKTYHSHSFRNKAFSCEFWGKHAYELRDTEYLQVLE